MQRHFFTTAILLLALGCSGKIDEGSSDDGTAQSELSGSTDANKATAEAKKTKGKSGEGPCTDDANDDGGRPGRTKGGKPGEQDPNDGAGKPPPPKPGGHGEPTVCVKTEDGDVVCGEPEGKPPLPPK